MVAPIDANERLSAARSSRDHKIRSSFASHARPTQHRPHMRCSSSIHSTVKSFQFYSITPCLLWTAFCLSFDCGRAAAAAIPLYYCNVHSASRPTRMVRRWIFGVFVFIACYMWVCGECKRCDPSRCSSTHKRCVAHVFICFIYLNLKSI